MVLLPHTQRFGHSLVSSELKLVSSTGVASFISLHDVFFKPNLYNADPSLVDKTIGGLISQAAQELDTKINEDLRSFLFSAAGEPTCVDLAVFNIQRGRDHGLLNYNLLRVALGLEPKDGFANVTSDPDVQAQLAAVYTDVDEIDPWVGILAEDHFGGGSMGELGSTILKDQVRVFSALL
jgi:peroxidase